MQVGLKNSLHCQLGKTMLSPGECNKKFELMFTRRATASVLSPRE